MFLMTIKYVAHGKRIKYLAHDKRRYLAIMLLLVFVFTFHPCGVRAEGGTAEGVMDYAGNFGVDEFNYLHSEPEAKRPADDQRVPLCELVSQTHTIEVDAVEEKIRKVIIRHALSVSHMIVTVNVTFHQKHP